MNYIFLFALFIFEISKHVYSHDEPDPNSLVARIVGNRAYGTVYIRFNPDRTLLFILDVRDLESNCVGCKISIMDSCEEVGKNYYNDTSMKEDPWERTTYDTDNEGFSRSGFRIDNGYNLEKNNDHYVVLFSSDRSSVGCGWLHRESTDKILVAYLSVYPNYSGYSVYGHVALKFHDDKSFNLTYNFHNTEKNCKNCGIHINTGTGCDRKYLGHELIQGDVRDLWTLEGGAVYSSDSNGDAIGWFIMYNGYDFKNNYHHTIVIHSRDGTRIACGVLL